MKTALDLSAIHGVSERQIRRWAMTGIIPIAVREGKILRFDPDDVAKALKQRARLSVKVKQSNSMPTY